MITWEKFQGVKEEWNHCINSITDCNLYNSFAWGEHKDALGWEVVRYYGKQSGEVKVAIQALLKRRFGLTVIWIPGGVMSVTTEWPNLLKDLIRKEWGILSYCRINALVEFDLISASRIKDSKWSAPSARLNSGLTAVVDFKIVRNLSENWKKNLKKSLKSKLSISKWEVPNLEEIDGLFKEMEKQKGLSSQQSINELNSLYANLNSDLLVFQCRNEAGELLAVRGAAVFRNVVWEIFAASSEEARKTSAAYRLFSQMIEYCEQRGYHRYDLGGIDPENGKGVSDFKMGLGSRELRYLGEWEWSSLKAISFLINFNIRYKGKAF